MSTSCLTALVRHYDQLVDALRRRFGDPHLARDVAQDVCVRLLESPPADTVREPMAYLRHMSTHLAIDRCRVETRRAQLLTQVDPAEYMAPPAATPEDAAIGSQQADALLAAIRRLPARCQEVFILHRLYHVPQTEIAARLGISQGMVARHVARAMTALQPLISDSSPLP